MMLFKNRKTHVIAAPHHHERQAIINRLSEFMCMCFCLSESNVSHEPVDVL